MSEPRNQSDADIATFELKLPHTHIIMPTRKKAPDTNSLELFPELPIPTPEEVEKELKFPGDVYPVWTRQKARLIQKYLYFFVMVTRHGTYIDGFAGPQSPENAEETWAAKLVIESRPRFLRNFFLCEKDLTKINALNALWEKQPPREKNESKRRCFVKYGDFNTLVDEILGSDIITEKEAAFALLDQRTFECQWATVRKLAQHKRKGNKIELFYFLAAKWLHRSMGGIRSSEGRQELLAWWGKDDWLDLQEMSQTQILEMMCSRFKKELGYRYAFPFPIHSEEEDKGVVMYYMIHATDHNQAPGLMWRAYRQVHPRTQYGSQLSFDGL